MATIPTTVIGQAGTAIAFTAAVGPDAGATGPDVKLLIKNGSGASITVTIATPGKVDGDLDITDRAVTVAAGATTGVPLTDRYRDPSTGLASWTYSLATSVTVAVVR